MMEGRENKSLKARFAEAQKHRAALDGSFSSADPTFQANLASAISSYEECLRVANAVSLFSPNEAVEDVNTDDLPYLLLHFHLAEVVLKANNVNRKMNILRSRLEYEAFLRQLDQYDLLGKEYGRLYEQYNDNPQKFKITSVTDPTKRRELTIQWAKTEKAMKQNIQQLEQSTTRDEAAARELYLANISYSVHKTFHELEMIARELEMLAMAPPAPADPTASLQGGKDDIRQRPSRSDGYNERLDPPLSQLSSLQGPILDKNGRPLRPFTLLDNRQRHQDGVFRPDHLLPTMTIDEYLKEERRRGGMIEGGGEQSGVRPEPNEDDLDKADEETMKARAWDEFKEANPKGSGNTMNMG